mmetsp:Transcript_4486/g.11436  ORF Transcript_4486/g.11436 Transcript_4486/m.11436 type:complete len:130 (-) Transcript_4486:254-643(-)
MSSSSIAIVAGGKPCHRLRPKRNSNNKTQRKKVKNQGEPVALPLNMENFGRVDHYFQSPNKTQEPQGAEFLKQLFQHPHSSCIAVQGGGTEGYVVNRAFITETQQTQEKLLQMVESLKRENEKLKSMAA